MMKNYLLIAATAVLFTACSGSYNPFQPDTPGDLDPTDPSGGGDSSVDVTIAEYDGAKADDAASDVVDSQNGDLYWEAGSYTDTVLVVFSTSGVSVSSNDSKILAKTDGGHAVIDFQTNEVSNVNIICKGTSTDGSLKIYGGNKFKLTLNGLDITSKKGPAINNQCNKRMFLHLTAGSVNRITDCETYGSDIYTAGTDEDRKGCLFSEGNIIVSGTGVLVVAGLQKHGICTDGSFVVRPGATIAVTQAAKNGLHVKGDSDDSTGILFKGGLYYANIAATAGKAIKCDMGVDIRGGKLDLNTTGNATYDSEEADTSCADCIKADGSISITGGTISCKSTGTAGKGINSESDIVIGTKDQDGPTISITTTGSTYSSTSTRAGFGGGGNPGGGGMPGGGGGTTPGGSSNGSSAKAMKAQGKITINSGTITIATAQSGAEGIESKTSATESIVVNGGDISLQCYDDCINSAGQIVFNGGRVFAYSPGNDAIDSNYGRQKSIVVNGGVVIAHGTSSPEEGIDADSNSYITLAGGTIFVTGGAQGGGTSSGPSCSQPCLMKSISVSKGFFTVTDNSGNVIFSAYVPRAMSSSTTMISSSSFKSGSTYKYGTLSAAPSGASGWTGYYLTGGTASVSTGSFTAGSGLTTK